MKKVNNRLYFDNRREFELNTYYSGLSIAPNGDLTSGYDDRLWNTEEELSDWERKEIAEFMISEWKQWGRLE